MVSKSKLCLILTSFVATISLSCAPNMIQDLKPNPSSSSSNVTSNSNSKFELLSGNSTKGFTDGSLVNARFNNPTSMDIDDFGNLYILDQNIFNAGKAIRKITPEGKVSTVIDFIDEGSYIVSFKIKDNYIYFSDGRSVKRFNLKDELKIENIVGSDENKDITGDFEIARFNSIDSITIDNEDNIFILDSAKVKKANLKTRKVQTIEYQVEGSTASSYSRNLVNSKDPSRIYAGESSNLNINPKNNQLYFILVGGGVFNFTSIYQINSINQILDVEIPGFPGSFTFDKDGNMYMVSIGAEKLFRISLENKTDELSGFSGVLKIEKGDQFPEFGNWAETNLAVDSNRGILYMSTSENKIFKLNLKR